MRASEAINRLRHEGWQERPGHGSGIVFSKDGRTVIVASHQGDIPTGTLRAICRQAGWEFPQER